MTTARTPAETCRVAADDLEDYATVLRESATTASGVWPDDEQETKDDHDRYLELVEELRDLATQLEARG
jgi:hypothetical protein